MTRLTADDAADLVFDCLSRMDPTIDEACQDTGMARSQWHNGLGRFKDYWAAEKTCPYTYDPVTGRYSLALDEDEVRRYLLLRMKIAAKQMERLRTGTLNPAADKFDSPQLRRIVRHVRVCAEEIDDLIGELA